MQNQQSVEKYDQAAAHTVTFTFQFFSVAKNAEAKPIDSIPYKTSGLFWSKRLEYYNQTTAEELACLEDEVRVRITEEQRRQLWEVPLASGLFRPVDYYLRTLQDPGQPVRRNDSTISKPTK